MNREQFKQQIFQQWANRYHCPIEQFEEPANVIIRKEQSSNAKRIHIWSIGQRIFVEVDSAHIDVISAAGRRLPASQPLSAEDVAVVLGEEAIQDVTMGMIHYLYPTDLPDKRGIKDCHVRQMKAGDIESQQSLFAVSMPEEVDAGSVNITDDIAFGALHNGQLVALASAYPWLEGECLDIGVLVHPEFRRYGLGKAVVREVCAWGIDKGYMIQYRNNAANEGALGIAKGLGFEQYLSQTSIQLK